MAHLLPPAGMKSTKHEAFMFNTVWASNFFQRDTSGGIPPNIHDYKWTDYKEVDRRFRALEAAFEATNRQKLNSMSVHRTMFNPAVPCPATLHEQRLVPPCPCPQHRGVGYKGGKDCACMEDRPSEIAPSGGRDGGNNLDVSQGTYQLTAVGQGDGAGVHGGDGSSKKRFSHAGQQQHSRASGFRPTHIADHGWGYCPPIGLDPRCLIRPRNTALHNSVRPTGDPYFAQETKSSCPEPPGPPALHRSRFTFDDWLQTADQREPPGELRNSCVPSVHQYCKPVSQDWSPCPVSFVPLHQARRPREGGRGEECGALATVAHPSLYGGWSLRVVCRLDSSSTASAGATATRID
ncbi:hypothetical protein RRG08_022822 [Elysia crispata]|uniref:Uncharacterized protein n=1 Tax=Elysia crispata TaxID=231223 RepID=A0AAE0Z0K5_9GAST|nr:hypothetical protein RRG08_022822 [Elysia crispata]